MERRYSKEDEALEIKSLRRIISAYLKVLKALFIHNGSTFLTFLVVLHFLTPGSLTLLFNKIRSFDQPIMSLFLILTTIIYCCYSDAADEDVRRYERSYKQLSPAHKVLLSHLPLKFQRLRRCIARNTHFIMEMLQAFEPPLDMSQDIDFDEREKTEDASDYHIHSESSRNFGQNSTSSGQPTTVRKSDASGIETSSFKGVNIVPCESLNQNNEKEEMHLESSHNSIMGRSTASEYHIGHGAIPDDARFTASAASRHHDSTANGKVGSPPRDWLDPSLQLHVPLVDVDKVRCIIRNIVRDWAPEGEKEREQCYKPIIEELNRLFPIRCKERPPSCLVPGAGLGRLALEISCAGFASEGNEFSYYMMICSSFILNHTQAAREWTIYPWIHSNCNSFSDNDQLRPVFFPDIHPASAGITEGFSMCGGDFVEVYSDVSQEASWDAVVTCFFLDTAHNIVEYIEIISKILKDGGVWINLGPLLYHFADTYGTNDEMSVELSLEDVKNVAIHYGFELEVDKTIETTYTTNPRSMMQNRYFAAFWTMRKIPKK